MLIDRRLLLQGVPGASALMATDMSEAAPLAATAPPPEWLVRTVAATAGLSPAIATAALMRLREPLRRFASVAAAASDPQLVEIRAGAPLWRRWRADNGVGLGRAIAVLSPEAERAVSGNRTSLRVTGASRFCGVSVLLLRRSGLAMGLISRDPAAADMRRLEFLAPGV